MESKKSPAGTRRTVKREPMARSEASSAWSERPRHQREAPPRLRDAGTSSMQRGTRLLPLATAALSASLSATRRSRRNHTIPRAFCAVRIVTPELIPSSKTDQKRRYTADTCDPDHTQHVSVMIEILSVVYA